MRFIETPLPGAYLVVPEPITDPRGSFARIFCATDFAARGLDPRVSQCNLSFNERKGTLRGLHYQRSPHGETKLVSCIQGAMWDVIVDLRPDSPTFGRWFGQKLDAVERAMLYVPEGFAHGFQTLEDATTVHYQMSSPYQAEAAAGIHWSDPTLDVPWPLQPPIVSDRDAALGPFRPGAV